MNEAVNVDIDDLPSEYMSENDMLHQIIKAMREAGNCSLLYDQTEEGSECPFHCYQLR